MRVSKMGKSLRTTSGSRVIALGSPFLALDLFYVPRRQSQLLCQPRIAFGFKLFGELKATGSCDAPAHEDVDHVGTNVVQQALIVSDQDDADLGAGELVDTAGHML